MEYFLQQLINGVTLGSIYGLIAIGYTMVFGIIGMVNFAHGDVFMLSTFIALIFLMVLTQLLGIGSLAVALFIVLIVAMVLTSLWSWAIERLAYRPLRGSFRLAPLISAIGMSIFLSNFVQVMQGPRNKPVPSVLGEVITLTSGGGDGYAVTLSYKQILIMVVTAVLLAAFWYVVQKTSLGRAQRACEQDRRMAALLGVDVDKTISLTFVMGAALAAVAGLLFMIYYGVVHFNDGFVPGVKAFTAAVLGGIGSLPGAVLGGLLIGLIETMWSAYFSIDYKDVATFSILAIMLDLHALGAARQARSREGVTPMAVDAAAEHRTMASRSIAALKDATGAALLALGLCRADPGAAHRAEHLKPADPAAALGLCRGRRGAGVRARASSTCWRPRCPVARIAARAGHRHARDRPSSGSRCCCLYPVLALALAGTGGAIKWIDNFGIQILIYIMLGWGLNIVVGLAGLLDLGYVAFYAVGAYSYALLATSDPVKAFMAEWLGRTSGLWAFWICLPLAGILAAFWGILLGFPVLRLRGDYLAIVTLAFGEIIRLVLINWVPVTNGYAGIIAHSRARPSSAFRSTPATRASPPCSASRSRRSTAPSSCST